MTEEQMLQLHLEKYYEHGEIPQWLSHKKAGTGEDRVAMRLVERGLLERCDCEYYKQQGGQCSLYILTELGLIVVKVNSRMTG